MPTKLAATVREPQAVVVIPAAPAAAPAEAQPKPVTIIDRLAGRVKTLSEDYVKRMKSELEIGTQIQGFPVWDCLSYGPYAYDPLVSAPPDYLPNKVVAAGDSVWMYGLIWINPVPLAGLRLTDVFANRPYIARFETINRTLVQPGPAIALAGTFPDADAFPADNIFWVSWEARFPDPGVTPNLYEMDLTIDLTQGGLQYAAFGTWHFDPDTTTPFPGPHWQFERAAKFMVYHR